jgi:hypothetical protein
LIETVPPRLSSAVQVAVLGPVRAYHADSAPEPATMIGRRTELAVLDARMDLALNGRPAFAMLVGEPGIGKTTLLRALAERAAGRGFAVAAGRCSQDDGAPPLWPWTAVLRDLDRDLAAPDRPAAADVQAGEAARFRLWEEIAAELTAAAVRRPLLVVLDDLHWADPSSLRVLRHVVTSVTAGRLAVVGARRARPEPAGPLAEVGEAMARHGAARIDLAGLDTDEVRALVTAVTGRAADPADAARLRNRTGGNAFLLTELVRLDAPDAVPAAVADVVAARVDRLPPATRDLLRAAAVIGRDFGTGLLATITGGTPDGVLDDLDPALAEGLVVEDDADQFRFSHALVRDAVYAGVPASRRARRHAAVATATGDPAQAARHWLAAGPAHARRAWQAAAVAARQAMDLYAWDEAADLLAAAVEAQRADPAATGRERYDLLMSRVEACRPGSDLAGLDEAQTAAAAAAAALGDVSLVATAAIAAVDGSVWLPRAHGTVHPTLVGTLRSALWRLPAADSELRCRVMLALAAELYFVPDTQHEREALVEQGLAISRRLDDPVLVVWACTAAFMAVWRPATAEDRWRWSGEALAAAQRAGDPLREVTARTLLAFTAQETGRIDEMWQHATLARAEADRLRLAAPLVALGWLEMPWYALQGRFAEAERLFAATVELMGRTSMPQGPESAAGAGMALRMARGAVDPETIGQLQALAPYSRLPLDSSIVLLLLRAGQPEQARAWYAEHGMPLGPDDWYSLLNRCQAAEAAAGLGERDLAVTLYRELAPFAGRPCSAGGAIVQAPVDAYLALVAAAAGETEVAGRHADAALAQCERWGVPLVADWLRGHRGRGGF